jgi:hypothetical protein
MRNFQTAHKPFMPPPMFSNSNIRPQRLLVAFRPWLMLAFALRLDYSVAAQNAPTPQTILTGDKLLYSRHAASTYNVKQPQGVAQAHELTPHERRIGRRQYQNQHRAEFPNVYWPGIE